MQFKKNQKVMVKKEIRSDGTCFKSARGKIIANKYDKGFIKEITEFLFDTVIVVHFLEKNKVIGFRKDELEIIEDYDEEKNIWIELTQM